MYQKFTGGKMDSDKDPGLIGRVQNLLKPVEEISKLGFFCSAC